MSPPRAVWLTNSPTESVTIGLFDTRVPYDESCFYVGFLTAFFHRLVRPLAANLR